MQSNSYATPIWPKLGPEFYDEVRPARFPQAILRYQNQRWAEKIGLGSLLQDQWQEHFCRFKALPNNLTKPLALRYHGHQFLHYNPDLGDGRGFLFAQIREKESQKIYDLSTKGSGQTPWSRRGDGRLTLKGAVREALATTFLESQGVNTSKTFCFFETGESLERHDEPSPTRSAVLTRLMHGSVRIGTFQRLTYLGQKNNIDKLYQFCLEHYYPDIQPSVENFFSAVCKSVAQTTAQWMIAGFVHGVLNTDNINITGESFDYGPYRFLPYYDRNFVAAYFDQSGLYAYGQQPKVLLWNLQQLALCLQLLDNSFDMQKGFAIYQEEFTQSTYQLFLKKLNLLPRENTAELLSVTLDFMENSRVPFEYFFYDWQGGTISRDRALSSPRASFYKGEKFNQYFNILKKFEPQRANILDDPYFARQEPVHLIIDEIEKIWSAIADQDDWSLFKQKISQIESRIL